MAGYTMLMGRVQELPRMIWRGDVLFALSLMGILVVLLLPMHPLFLDAALALSLAFSIIVLMTVLFLESPLELSMFPTILLVVTMLRLALNVASTRLILSGGHQGVSAAGKVIKAFGSFIMSGNFVIGLVVFSILVIINFVVITKGSGRIAEVVARFSLDALPGKQMAVDADLASNLIDQDTARKRREVIQDEINFYGAMDGAAKFVRGDAIAGLLITAINLLGGILVGTLQKGLSAGQALHTYSFLTVGDGLVSQVPALIVSVSAGMLISKTSSKGKADQVLFGQLGAYPMAMGLSAFMMLVLSFLPGMPTFPFMSLAAVCGFLAYRILISAEAAQKAKAAHLGETTQKETADTQAGKSVKEASAQTLLIMDDIKVEFGIGLVSLIRDKEALTEPIQKVRSNMAKEFGLIIPTVRIVDNLSLGAQNYRIKVKEIQAAAGQIYPNKYLALRPDGQLPNLPGEKGKEPVLGLEGIWITKMQLDGARKSGHVIADGKQLLLTHLGETLKRYLPDLFSFAQQQRLVNSLPKPFQKLYADLVPLQLPAAVVQRVLKNLLAERVSIRDLPLILESLAEGATDLKDPQGLTERVRQLMARPLSAPFLTKEGILKVSNLSLQWSEAFYDALKAGENKRLVMPPSQVQEFWDRLGAVYGRVSMQSQAPSMRLPPLLVNAAIRPYVYQVTSQIRPDIFVISDAELYAGDPLEVIEEI